MLLLGAEQVKAEARQNGGRVESYFPEEHIPSPIEIPGANSQDAASTIPKPNKPSAPPRPSRDRVPEMDSGSVSLPRLLSPWTLTLNSPTGERR